MVSFQLASAIFSSSNSHGTTKRSDEKGKSESGKTSTMNCKALRRLLLMPALTLGLVAMTLAGPANQAVVGNRRVTALSETLVRVELAGPLGFEDRATFGVVGRDSFAGVPIRSVSSAAGITTIVTDFYRVALPDVEPGDECNTIYKFSSLKNGKRVEDIPYGQINHTLESCCKACRELLHCAAWELQPTTGTCFLLDSNDGTIVPAADRVLGWGHRTGFVELRSADGSQLLHRVEVLGAVPSLLDFPTPRNVPRVFALRDSPRIVPPPWGATPAPDNYTGPCNATSGFDLRNAAPDAYFFIVPQTTGGYQALRREYLKLIGPVPQLPDYAFGTWFTWYHSYTQTEAMEEAQRFAAHNISLDVFGLDVGWRDSRYESDYVINTKLFPNMRGYLSWLASRKLHCYFNDHPESVRPQMSPEEVRFRYNGLTSVMDIGLDYWWFDSNWVREIIRGVFGLDQRVWVQYVYRSVLERYNKEHRPNVRTHTLAMYTSQHPAHHRFPTHWTGDIHSDKFADNVRFSVDGGINFKAYVHPDCGGFIGNDSDELYTRWLQFCTLSNILRIHCSTGYHRQPWSYPNTEHIVKRFIDLRYSLMPTLISAGRQVTDIGKPIVERCDLQWPEYPEATRSDQYIWLDSILVAPVFPFPAGNSSRVVWVPPGNWENAWTGAIVTGPQLISTTSPLEQIPLFYRRGSLLVSSQPAQTVSDQSWDRLFVEAFPEPGIEAVRVLHGREGAAETTVLRMEQTGTAVALHIEPIATAASAAGQRRAWTVRVHTMLGSPLASLPTSVTIDGVAAKARIATAADINNGSELLPTLPFGPATTIILVDVPIASVIDTHKIILVW